MRMATSDSRILEIKKIGEVSYKNALLYRIFWFVLGQDLLY